METKTIIPKRTFEPCNKMWFESVSLENHRASGSIGSGSPDRQIAIKVAKKYGSAIR